MVNERVLKLVRGVLRRCRVFVSDKKTAATESPPGAEACGEVKYIQNVERCISLVQRCQTREI